MLNEYSHSVRLDKDLCRGCTNCIKTCPTEAIRVRDGKAHINDDRCIDCGECVRTCPYHAKIAITDYLDDLENYKYCIALPAPTLYGQFKRLNRLEELLHALKQVGFDDVFDVSRAADVITMKSREYLETHAVKKPVISSACPAVVRLMQIRFPELLSHVLPVIAPNETAARIAKEEYALAHGVAYEEIGAFFITPCAAKMTAKINPIGFEKSSVDGCLSILDLYGALEGHIGKDVVPEDMGPMATKYGIGWALTGGEAIAMKEDGYLAVDGIANVIQVLEEIENGKFSDLDFFEGLSCIGGCVGGPLVFENRYVAKNRIRQLTEGMEEPLAYPADVTRWAGRDDLNYNKGLEPKNVMKLDDDISKAIRKMERMEQIYEELPGLDCGSCGAPTCRALAEDIVRGEATELDCIFKLRDKLKVLAQELVTLADNQPFEGSD
ncbi:4Fe-4S dicluster domain-containing protein [Eubacteriales bacterium OttesenSCG-928-M02]|nr:4Fe-4S dicluster domain-containing protein [Eubacteriales bacterium OttesenSCG-928-M02]